MVSAQVVLPLIGLAVLALVPVVYKKLRNRGRAEEEQTHD
jgi:hypothetical protein